MKKNTCDDKISFPIQLVNFISTFITTLVVLIAIAFIIALLLGMRALTIESDSMAPLYRKDTLILVKAIDSDTVSEGDVITYILDESDTLITHRVVSVNTSTRTVVTKGDANDTEDASPVSWDNIVGKVVFSIPKAGGVFRVISNEENRPIVIGVIVVLGVASVAWDVMERRSNKRKNQSIGGE